MEEAEITLTWSIVDVNVIKVFSEDFQMLEISLSLGNKNIIQNNVFLNIQKNDSICNLHANSLCLEKKLRMASFYFPRVLILFEIMFWKGRTSFSATN